uniref:Transposase n=1 Tax=Anopheles epiroticus TaxID=199890 RepID=A0A182PWP8_9DIPT
TDNTISITAKLQKTTAQVEQTTAQLYSSDAPCTEMPVLEPEPLQSENSIITDLRNQIFIMKKDIQDLNNVKADNANLRNKLAALSREKEQLQAEIATLKQDLKKTKEDSISPDHLHKHVKQILKETLTSNQIDMILKLKKRVTWTKPELGSAMTLRYFSKKAYNYMLTDMHYPLPSISTLKRYASRLNIKAGILNDVLNLVGSITRMFEPRDRECVLSFDEMKINKIVEYDQVSDEVVGPYNYLQVVMARGLFKKWKQPVFIGFDTKMTKEILLTVIKKLTEIGINVVAIVSDNCQSNIGCWKELGAHDPQHPYFLHPSTEQKIFVFPDAPHLLKLIRHWLIDHGFEHKVALKHYYPNDENATNLAAFIEKIDLWFSVSNTYSPNAKLDYKKSFIGSEDQKQALLDMFDLIKSIVPIGKANMQVFQKSILMHMQSLQMLFEEMKSKHGLNQDVLENFFSQLRQKGGVNDHPSPLSCIHRIRIMILGKAPSALKNQTDLGPDTRKEQDEYISSENQTLQEEDIISNMILTRAEATPNLSEMEDADKENEVSFNDNSDVLNSVSSTEIELPEQDGDGLEYILGYIAKKYHTKYPELKMGEYTFKTSSVHDYCQPPSFVRHLSVGGLFAPSESFLRQGYKMEKMFLKLNPEGAFRTKRG